jgi:hypothetical protein
MASPTFSLRQEACAPNVLVDGNIILAGQSGFGKDWYGVMIHGGAAHRHGLSPGLFHVCTIYRPLILGVAVLNARRPMNSASWLDQRQGGSYRHCSYLTHPKTVPRIGLRQVLCRRIVLRTARWAAALRAWYRTRSSC